MYLSLKNPNLAISVPPAEPILKIWDIENKKLTKEYKLEGIFPSALMLLDDHRVLLWEMNKKCVFVCDFVKEEMLAEIKFNTSEARCPNNYTNCWAYVQEKDELFLFADDSNDLNIFDLKTGKIF